MQQTANALPGPFPDLERSWSIIHDANASAHERSALHRAGSSPRAAPTHQDARLDRLDSFIFMPCICLTAALGFSLGDYPMLFVIMPPLCLAYAIARRTVPPRLLTAYVALCLAAGLLSWYRAFATSWQIVFVAEAIPRQLAPIISFFCVSWAAKAYFLRRVPTQTILSFGGPIIVLGYVVAPFVMFLSGVRYEGDDTSSTILAAYGSFINSITLSLFFIFGHLFYSRGARYYAVLAVILLVAATTHFVQFKIVACAAIIMLIGFRPRVTVVAVAAICIASYAIQAYDIPAAIAKNPDKGIRVAFIADSFQSLYDTSGVGIGYGTESVRWVYRFPGVPDFTFMPDPSTITRARLLEVLSRGVHNSFAQALLRTGLFGFVLLTCAMFCAFPPRGLSRPAESHASMVFIVIFVACFVNPALESPRQLIGIGFSYGYLLALRACAKGRSDTSRLRLSLPSDSRSILLTDIG